MWVATEIVQVEDLKLRAVVLNRFIFIAQVACLLQIGSPFSLFRNAGNSTITMRYVQWFMDN